MAYGSTPYAGVTELDFKPTLIHYSEIT